IKEKTHDDGRSESPRAHEGVEPRKKPRLLREVPRNGAGEGEAGIREVSGPVRTLEPRALRGGAGRWPRARRPHGTPGRERRRRAARAGAREVSGAAGTRGDG